MLKKIVLTLCLVILSASITSANQLSTVGIVDIDKIYNSFYRDSRGVRDLERMRRQYQEEIDRHVERLQNLQDRRVEAQSDNDETRVAKLEGDILELRNFIEDLSRQRRRQLEIQQSRLISNDFLQELQSAIVYVAETEGYTVVFRTDTAGLQWWSNVVDISDRVLERLRATNR
jgi:outer membrane protein